MLITGAWADPGPAQKQDTPLDHAQQRFREGPASRGAAVGSERRYAEEEASLLKLLPTCKNPQERIDVLRRLEDAAMFGIRASL